MSDIKAPKKEKKTAKKAEKAEKTPAADTAEKTPAADTAEKTPEKAVEKTADSSTPVNKSASESSISHFSSVVTKEYRSGWESIFGNKTAGNSKKSNKSKTIELPASFEIRDEDIAAELRAVLYKAFQRQARKEGANLSAHKKVGVIEYRLNCNISEK
jgi:hypothetical protein